MVRLASVMQLGVIIKHNHVLAIAESGEPATAGTPWSGCDWGVYRPTAANHQARDNLHAELARCNRDRKRRILLPGPWHATPPSTRDLAAAYKVIRYTVALTMNYPLTSAAERTAFRGYSAGMLDADGCIDLRYTGVLHAKLSQHNPPFWCAYEPYLQSAWAAEAANGLVGAATMGRVAFTDGTNTAVEIARGCAGGMVYSKNATQYCLANVAPLSLLKGPYEWAELQAGVTAQAAAGAADPYVLPLNPYQWNVRRWHLN